MFQSVSIGNTGTFGNLHIIIFNEESWVSSPNLNMYMIGSKNHCDRYKGHIQPQTYWFSPDPYPLESNPPLTTLLTSLESRLGFPTSKKQNPNKYYSNHLTLNTLRSSYQLNNSPSQVSTNKAEPDP